MDYFSNDTEVLGSQRSVETAGFVVTVGEWKVRELLLSQEKLDWLWEQIKQFPTLFSDLTKTRKAHVFVVELENPASYWLEVLDEEDKTIGIVYLTNLQQQIDANLHLMFIDRNLSNKNELVKAILEFIFTKFPALHRITASMPAIYFAVRRLAKSSGLVEEGVSREALLIGGKFIDEVHYGILAREVL